MSRKTSVLTFVADSKRKLMVGNGNVANLVFRILDFDLENICRSKSRRNELLGIFAVIYNVDLLAAENVNNLIYS